MFDPGTRKKLKFVETWLRPELTAWDYRRLVKHGTVATGRRKRTCQHNASKNVEKIGAFTETVCKVGFGTGGYGGAALPLGVAPLHKRKAL